MKGSGDLATCYLRAADILATADAANDDCVKRAAHRAAERFRARGYAILNGTMAAIDHGADEARAVGAALAGPTDR